MINSKPLNEVFKKVRISRPVLNSIGLLNVESLKVNPDTGTMRLELGSDYMIDDNSIAMLRDDLKREFAYVDKIDIIMKYAFPKTQTEPNTNVIPGSSRKETDWSWLINKMELVSPVCGKILQKSVFRADGSNLHIGILNSGLYFITKTGMDKTLKELAAQAGMKIVFEPGCENTGRSAELTKMAVKKAVSELEINLPSPATHPGTSSGQPSGFFGNKSGSRKKMKLRDEIKAEPFPLSGELIPDNDIVVQGLILECEHRETKKGGFLYTADITDGTGSATIKFFLTEKQWEDFGDELSTLMIAGKEIKISGRVQNDEYSKEINIMVYELCEARLGNEKRMDIAADKRVELHLHTTMSAADGMASASAYIKRAAEWGHKAIAITDHGVVQAFPEAMQAAAKHGVKVIYGVEAYIIDDLGAIAQGVKNQRLSDEFVVFDLETTGLSKDKDKITEIGAVKIINGEIIDRFSSFVDPGIKLSEEIIKLTGITDDMLVDAPTMEQILPEFLCFAGEAVLVAHNAAFDMGFITAAKAVDNTVLDTLELSRMLFPELGKHKLDKVAKHLGVSLENHHRAVDDAEACARIFLKCADILKEKGVNRLDEINLMANASLDKKSLRHHHAVILVKNKTGLRNLYELVSISHIEYFHRRPRIPKSEYMKRRDGLIIGSACEAGELYTAVRDNKSDDILRELAGFYDYFEIQPIGNNMFMIRDGSVASERELEILNMRIVELGDRYHKPVVATCDVHFLDPGDEVFRRIIMAGEKFKDADNQAPLYFRTTDEMLREFNYLPPEKAIEVVITNTNNIADSIDDILPLPKETFVPKIDGAEENIRNSAISTAKQLYGDDMPEIVSARIERELDSIIKNGYAVMYAAAQMLVSKSLSDGYLVGSRGSVGSSLAATMTGITEVNPLKPHYLCPNCRYSDFDSDEVKKYFGMSGCDMPDMDCPVCGSRMNKDGHEIPFETFMGFNCDKEPDIDLNFSGEYQSRAQEYTEEIFGSEYVFKAGTISTIAEKTAYGYVMKYMESKGIMPRGAEIRRLRNGCAGIRKTSGQHPGGLMIVPRGHSIYEFCPIQRPANDQKSNVITTHFDYHSMKGRLLKLDILGHDVPTIIRLLHDYTGFDPSDVDIADKEVISLFTGPSALGVSEDEIGCKTGTLGLPEFGTHFVRQMLLETKPASFSELIRISGLSHGTDVWTNNAQELVRSGTATLKEIISTRDDIMVYLVGKGVEKLASFKIMENVRNGRGLKPEEEELMRNAEVPEWYIESCKKIKYLFPKAHAVAYVMMTMRIAYYKINFPYAFYAANFSVKADDFDYELMCLGPEKVHTEIKRIHALGKEATGKDKSKQTLLELLIEMYARKLKFVKLDLYKSDAVKFLVTADGIMPPLCSLQGLGAQGAEKMAAARAQGEFDTIEDFRERTKINKSVTEVLKKQGILDGLSETNQLSLF